MPTAEPRPSTMSTPQMLISCAVAFVVLNAFFYFMSTSYFESHRATAMVGSITTYTDAQMTQVRVAFAIFTGVVAVIAFAGWKQPRLVGHVLAALFGAFYIVIAFPAFSRGAPAVLGTTWLVSGVALLVLSHFSYRRHSRAAWAPLVAICAVLAAAEVFGAPKLARAVDVTLWLAMLLPGLKVVAVVALASVRDEYVDGGAAMMA